MPPEAASALQNLRLTTEGPPDEGETLHEQIPDANHPNLRPAIPEMRLPPAQLVFAGLRMAKGW